MSNKKELKEKANAGDAQAQYELAYKYANAFFARRKKAAKLYAAAAEQNHTLAQYRLGECYKLGKGVKKNMATALSWYEKAASSDNAAAHYEAGLMYRYGGGGGIELDLKKAVEHFLAAIDKKRSTAEHGAETVKNISLAECEMGKCYFDGIGVDIDYTRATAMFNNACIQDGKNYDQPYAKIGMGNACRYGRGVARNTEAAVKQYKKASAMNCSDADVALGDLYLGFTRDHYNVDCDRNSCVIDSDWRENKNYIDRAKAFRYYKKAANGGNWRGRLMVDLFKFFYCKEISVKMEEREPAFRDILWLADHGLSDAQCVLGEIYYYGDDRGNFRIKKNEKLSKEWFLKAAKQGDCCAMWGMTFYDKKHGYMQSKWARRAAEFGSGICARWMIFNGETISEEDYRFARLAYERGLRSEYSSLEYEAEAGLSYCYLKGIGTAKDINKARELYLKVRQTIVERVRSNCVLPEHKELYDTFH